MAYWSIRFDVAREQAEALSDAFIEAGALAADIGDARDGMPDEDHRFAEPGGDPGLWQSCRLSILLPGDAAASAVAKAVFSGVDATMPEVVVTRVDDADWVALSRQQFRPIQVTPNLWIVPTWCDPPVQSAINIRLDPGAAFGTGSHPTTRMCLRWIEEHRAALAGRMVLDYGCGSGILAIAAMKMGAREALGLDIDASALDAARANALANDTAIRFESVEQRLHMGADVVLANILANPLKVLAPALASHTLRGGHLVLAGLLDSQADELIDIYGEWFDIRAAASEEGWTCLAGQRR
jgi:ribosomal protein L11 methyltransferase